MKIFPPLLTKIKQGYTTFKAEKRQKIRETATKNQGNSDRKSGKQRQIINRAKRQTYKKVKQGARERGTRVRK